LIALSNARPEGRLVFDLFLGLMADRGPAPAGETQLGDKLIKRRVGRRLGSDGIVEVMPIYETYVEGQQVDQTIQRSQAGVVTRARGSRC
jgi:hypothetical protein